MATNEETLGDKIRTVFYRFTTPILLLLFAFGFLLIFSFINAQQNALIVDFANQEEKLQKIIETNKDPNFSSYHAHSLLTQKVFEASRESLKNTFFVLTGSLAFYLLIIIFVVRKLKANAKQLHGFVEQLQGMNTELHQEILERDNMAQKLADLNGELKYQSLHDTLTKLPNRRLFEDRLNAIIQISKRMQRIFAVMFIDLDGFKLINDSLGHDVGDELLKEVSRQFSSVIRTMDTVARFGGDEFAIILGELDKPEAAAYVAERLIKQLTEKPILIKDQALEISASIGITIYPYDSNVSQVLLKNADIAMYQAKNLGPGNFKYYREEMNTLSRRGLILRNSLHTAIQSSQLELYYQPIIDVKERNITCFEALLRWNHPQLGFIPPEEILRAAYNLHLLVPLGDWIIDNACQQMKTWQQEGLHVEGISINIASLQFEMNDFAQKLFNTLNIYQLDPQKVTLEVNESSLINNVDSAISLFQELNHRGIKIAIDDFGTGYSSLNYLRKLPIQVLKIDQSFIKEMETNTNDTAILRAIMMLAQELNLEVIAEGVETQTQMQMLRDLGCTHLQGYLFSKPLPADQCHNIEMAIE